MTENEPDHQPEPRTHPNFDAWVEYCFVHGHADFAGESKDPQAVIEAREAEFVDCIDAVTLTEHLIRLFESPSFIADRYSDAQIADAIWFVLGSVDYFAAVGDEQMVPETLRDRCIKAVVTLFTDLFDPICMKKQNEALEAGRDPSSWVGAGSHVEGAVFMAWEMNWFGHVALPEGGPEHAFNRGVSVVESILMRCSSDACRLSALHAIGHAIGYLDEESSRVKVLQGVVDRFLDERKPPRSLIEYASEARLGRVM